MDPDVFVYFSDHGEDVYGKKMHNAAQFNYAMARVPLVMGFSERWVERNRDKYNLLQSRVNAPFTLDLFFETMLGIGGVEGYDFDRRYCLAADEYAIGLDNAVVMKTGEDLDRRYYTKSSVKKVSEDPEIVAADNVQFVNLRYPGKVLSVYNDFKAKAFESKAIGFKGVEFNFSAPDMVLGHYPDIVLNTTLNDFLSWSPIRLMNRLWFDMRTMRGHSIVEAVKPLNELDKIYHLKSRALVESWDDDLSALSSDGWFTSYYVFRGRWPECKDFTVDLGDCGRRVAEKAASSKARSISFLADDYTFVKKYVERYLAKDITYNVFGFGPDYSIYSPVFVEKVSSSQIFNDSRVRTILLESSAVFGLKLGDG